MAEHDILGEKPLYHLPDGRPVYPAENPQEAIHGPRGLMSPEQTTPRPSSDEELANDPRANEFRLVQREMPGMTNFDLTPDRALVQHRLVPDLGREGILPGIVNTVRRAFNGLRVQPMIGSATA